MKKQKILFSEWFKEYSILNVTNECFKNSLSIETVGSYTGIKINNKEHLNFLIKELKNKEFKEV